MKAFGAFIFSFAVGVLGFNYYQTMTENSTHQNQAQVQVEAAKPSNKRKSSVSLKQFLPTQSGYDIPEESRWIAELTFSDKPSHIELSQYLKQVIDKITKKRRLRPDDAEFILLSVLAEQDFQMVLDKLLELGSRADDYIVPLAKVYSTDADKQFILSRLKQSPKLVKVIQYHKWQADAKPYLVNLLEEKPASIGWAAMEILLDYNDPSLYPKFNQILEKGRYVDPVVSMIKDLPNTDYKDSMIKAWNKTTTLDRGYLSRHMLSIGYRPALDYVVEHLGDNDDGPNFSAAVVYSRHVEGPVGVKAAQRWYQANKDKLKFNPETQRFYLP